MAHLYELTADMAELEYILEESGGELTPEVEEALSTVVPQLTKKVDNINILIQKMKAQQEICKAEIERITKLKKTAENAEKRLKETVLRAMVDSGMDKLEGDLCKMYTRKSTTTTINEEEILSPYQFGLDEYRNRLPAYIQVEIKVNKTDFKKYIKENNLTPTGVENHENISLIIK